MNERKRVAFCSILGKRGQLNGEDYIESQGGNVRLDSSNLGWFTGLASLWK